MAGSMSQEKRQELWQLAREVGHLRFPWQARRATGEEFPVEVALTPVSHGGAEVLLAVHHSRLAHVVANPAPFEPDQDPVGWLDPAAPQEQIGEVFMLAGGPEQARLDELRGVDQIRLQSQHAEQ